MRRGLMCFVVMLRLCVWIRDGRACHPEGCAAAAEHRLERATRAAPHHDTQPDFLHNGFFFAIPTALGYCFGVAAVFAKIKSCRLPKSSGSSYS